MVLFLWKRELLACVRVCVCVCLCVDMLLPLPPVRILTRLLEVSDDPQVIAVAAHDVGEYVRHYPRGKR